MRRLLALGALGLFGCSGQPLTVALNEPVRVTYGVQQSAQFRAGALPGSAPLTGAQIQANQEPELPSVSGSLTTSVVLESDEGKGISGVASGTAVAVGIRFLDLGTGYWVMPVGNQNPVQPGSYTWLATLNFGGNIPPGIHPLAVVAIDGNGHGGSQVSTDVCVASDIPDNLSACSAARTPPATVLSLNWDTPVDLDLRVVTPDGKIVDAKHPSTALPGDKGTVDPSADGTGSFDTDALRNCVDTGRRRENLVWQQTPNPGKYFVYANLYDACGQAAVRFDLSLNQPVAGDDGGPPHLAPSFSKTGELLASDANGGTALGLFVTEFKVQ